MDSGKLQTWIEIIIRRQKTALWVACAVFATVLVVTILWPPIYQSSAEILVQDNRAQLLVSPDLRGSADPRAVVANPVNEEDMNSELEILTSQHLILKALDGLQPTQQYAGFGAALISAAGTVAKLPGTGYRALHQMPELTTREQWALQLAGALSANVVNRSDIIEIDFRANDAQWSKDFLSRLLNQYLEYHAHISHDPVARKVFAAQARLLKSRLHHSEDQLKAFEVATGIGSLPDQKTELVKQLSQMSIQYATGAAQLASAEQQVSALQALRRQTPERIGKETRSVQNAALQQLKPQVMQLRAERAELLSRYKPNSKRIKEIDAKLEAAQQILDRENKLEVEEVSTDLNPLWVSLGSSLSESEANAAALRAGQQALQQQIAQAQESLRLLVTNGVQVDRLQRQVEADKEAYMSYLRKAEEARVAQALNQSKLLSVSVVRPPAMPLKPAFPILWLNLLAGLVMGTGAGLAAVLWDEQNDPKIYSAASIAAVGGIRTIAVVQTEQ
jgi:uncharacterized protein involved in exopolysaccharide biosynthesis